MCISLLQRSDNSANVHKFFSCFGMLWLSSRPESVSFTIWHGCILRWLVVQNGKACVGKASAAEGLVH